MSLKVANIERWKNKREVGKTQSILRGGTIALDDAGGRFTLPFTDVNDTLPAVAAAGGHCITKTKANPVGARTGANRVQPCLASPVYDDPAANRGRVSCSRMRKCTQDYRGIIVSMTQRALYWNNKLRELMMFFNLQSRLIHRFETRASQQFQAENWIICLNEIQ